MIPATYRKLVVHTRTQKFREATQITKSDLPGPAPDQLLVKTSYVGVNASDINFTAGRYSGWAQQLPSGCGFEGLGVVVSVGSACEKVKVGQAVGYLQAGSFAEYVLISEKQAVPLPSALPEYLPLFVCGLTAAISLDKLGNLKPNDVVLVTAAAGGTGQFAVQLAKLSGCHVIGTCSDQDKVNFLKSIGCDRPVDYTKEDLAKVLKDEYSKGIDLVFECVGGEMFETCLKALKVKGQIIPIGFISGYQSDSGEPGNQFTTHQLLKYILGNSISVRGFLLGQWSSDIPEFIGKLIRLLAEGKIKSVVDNGKSSPKGPFKGLEAIPDAVDFMYSKKNIGKIYVEF